MIIMSVHTTNYARDNNWSHFPLTQAGTSEEIETFFNIQMCAKYFC